MLSIEVASLFFIQVHNFAPHKEEPAFKDDVFDFLKLIGEQFD
jgi:hypothetical protein